MFMQYEIYEKIFIVRCRISQKLFCTFMMSSQVWEEIFVTKTLAATWK